MTENSEAIEQAAADLFEVLGGKVPVDTLRKELDTFVNTYGIDIRSSKDAVMKKHNVNRRPGSYGGSGVTKKIAELEGTEMNVTVVAKMVFVERREISVRGTPRTIISGIAGDDTGTAPFTIWEDAGEFTKGQVYTFKNAYTKKWRDQVQLNIGNRGKVEPADGVSFDVKAAASAAEEMKISDITDATKNVTVTGTVTEVEPRTITVKGEPKTVWGGIVADDTGKIQFTAWNDFGLTPGMTVKAQNAYIRAWKGIPQLNFGDRTTVTPAKLDGTAKVDDGPTDRTVAEILRVGGGLDIRITGTLVDVRNGSGLINRCPQCNRSLQGEDCSVHGHVTPVHDLRLKATVDDGTGAVSVVIRRADAERITGITLEDAERMAQEKGDAGCVAAAMAAKVILKRVTVVGNVMTDDFGPQMTARTTEMTEMDVETEARKLRDEVEASL